jgi:hypothetical protein
MNKPIEDLRKQLRGLIATADLVGTPIGSSFQARLDALEHLIESAKGSQAKATLWLIDEEKRAAKLTTATGLHLTLDSQGICTLTGAINHVTLGQVSGAGAGLTLESAVKSLDEDLKRATRDAEEETTPGEHQDSTESQRALQEAGQ